ncbi:hypothetical protein [Paenibacillus gansuensis]|uniref:Uncharacterized protein n=1 Tax=Paenibacillus gansuensis TaxID=306542 RepID=A0ABW5PLE5_9BACL
MIFAKTTTLFALQPVDQLPLQPAARAGVLPTEIKLWKKNYSEQR